MPDYRCDYCERASADFIVGVIVNGDQTYLCAPCLPKFGNTIKKALKEAETAEQNAGVRPSEAAMELADQWEADYPQGRENAHQDITGADTEVPGSDPETAPAPVE